MAARPGPVTDGRPPCTAPPEPIYADSMSFDRGGVSPSAGGEGPGG